MGVPFAAIGSSLSARLEGCPSHLATGLSLLHLTMGRYGAVLGRGQAVRRAAERKWGAPVRPRTKDSRLATQGVGNPRARRWPKTTITLLLTSGKQELKPVRLCWGFRAEARNASRLGQPGTHSAYRRGARGGTRLPLAGRLPLAATCKLSRIETLHVFVRGSL